MTLRAPELEAATSKVAAMENCRQAVIGSSTAMSWFLDTFGRFTTTGVVTHTRLIRMCPLPMTKVLC